MRPAVLVARAVFPEVIARLRAQFEVDDNPDDTIWSADELSAALEPFSSRHLPHDGGGGASGGGQSGRHSRGGPADAAPGGKRSRAQWRELVPGWFSGSLGAS